MPNQRDVNKKRIAVWLTPEQRSLLDQMIADGFVHDMSDFVKKAIAEEAKRLGISDENSRD